MCIAKNVPMQRDHVKPCVVYTITSTMYFYCAVVAWATDQPPHRQIAKELSFSTLCEEKE